MSHYGYESTKHYVESRKWFKDRDMTNILQPEPFPLNYTTRHHRIREHDRKFHVTIGRMHPEKLLDLARDTNCRIYTTEPHPDFPDARANLSYRTIMSALCRAKAYFATLPVESLSITPFEAACRGVPTIAHAKSCSHGCQTYLPDWAVNIADTFRMRRPDSIAMFQYMLNDIGSMPTTERQELADYMWETHNMQKYISKVEELIEQHT